MLYSVKNKADPPKKDCMKQLRRIDSIPHAKQQLTRIIKAYFKGELKPEVYRNLIYGMSHLLSFQKAELDQEIEKRLDAIEEKLHDKV